MNGEGEDAGVVYCEMQGRENMEMSRTYLNFTREMYPGHCGYKVIDLVYLDLHFSISFFYSLLKNVLHFKLLIQK